MKTILIYILLAILPSSVSAKTPDISLQKKHSAVVDKAVEIYSEDIRKVHDGRLRDVSLYQLDMASNKEMKSLGSLRVPVLDFITKRDAYWLGMRKGKVVIVGSNGRGTAYGLMHLLRLGGSVDGKYETTEIPSVEFRGISMENINLSGNDCRKLFNIMLRMRANVLCAGWDKGESTLRVTKNLRIVADSFGIDLATPHDGNGLRLHGFKKDAQTVDVTWHDDGYGYMVPSGNNDDEGAAVYHLSYDGRPCSYLWLATTQPGLIYNEMMTAYRHGAKRLWMVALHDPNIAAYPLALFMDLAWNVDAVKDDGVQEHLKAWLSNKYGKDVAEKLIKPLKQYYRLTGIRRPELMDNAGFNAEEFGNELERYLNDYRSVCKNIETIGGIVDESKKDDYFLNVKYPVRGAALMADKTLEAQESRLIGRKPSFHHDDEALESAARSMKAYWASLSLTKKYNDIVSGKYWNKPIDNHLPVFDLPQLTDTVSETEVEKYYNAEPVYAPLSNDGCIVRNAYEYTTASDDVKRIDMLGHSMKAVELQKDGELTYRFRTDGVGGVLRLAFIPSFSPDGGSSQCSVNIDNGTPTTVIINDGSASSKRWQKGVLRGQSLITLPISLSSGMHSLTIKALNDHVVFDQWMIDRDTDREFYVFPCP